MTCGSLSHNVCGLEKPHQFFLHLCERSQANAGVIPVVVALFSFLEAWICSRKKRVNPIACKSLSNNMYGLEKIIVIYLCKRGFFLKNPV